MPLLIPLGLGISRGGVGADVGGGGTPEPETDAWETAVVADGGTVSAGRKTLVNDLIVGLKADGVFAKLDRLALFAAENTQSALREIVGANALTITATVTFTANRGYASANASGKVHTGITPSSPPPGLKFTTNSATMFVWSNTAGQQATMICGRQNELLDIWPAYTDGNFYGAINSVGNAQAVNSAGPVGLYSGNRSGANASQFYLNGASLVTDNVSGTQTLGAEVLAVFGDGNTRQVSCFGMGQSLNATEQGNLYARLRTYMTAVGVP